MFIEDLLSSPSPESSWVPPYFYSIPPQLSLWRAAQHDRRQTWSQSATFRF
jgi:hypothetical protein